MEKKVGAAAEVDDVRIHVDSVFDIAYRRRSIFHRVKVDSCKRCQDVGVF